MIEIHFDEKRVERLDFLRHSSREAPENLYDERQIPKILRHVENINVIDREIIFLGFHEQQCQR